MTLYDTTNPVLGELSIQVTNGSTSVELDRWLSYDYTEDFLSPSDEGHFILDEKELTSTERSALVPGAKVRVMLGGNPQSIGYLDEIEWHGSRTEGSIVRVTTRDWLSPAVDAHVDPNTRFNDSMTLFDVLTACFTPFGMDVLALDNSANRNAITGRIYGAPTSRTGKTLRSYATHTLKPYPQEGVFAFAARVSQRLGLWIWPAVDGTTVVVGQPDFDQPPRYGIQLQEQGNTGSVYNNVEDWHFKRSRREQPSVIYASGFGAGGVFPKSRLRAGIVNPLVNVPNLSTILDEYPDVTMVPVDDVTSAVKPFIEANPRPLFLYDSESHDQAQLEAFLKRELSLRMRKALTARYTFMGHALNGQPVAVDTIVGATDDKSGFQGPLWVLGRRFSKSATEGSRTNLDLVLPGSIQF